MKTIQEVIVTRRLLGFAWTKEMEEALHRGCGFCGAIPGEMCKRDGEQIMALHMTRLLRGDE